MSNPIFDLGDAPSIDPPDAAQQGQMRFAFGLGPASSTANLQLGTVTPDNFDLLVNGVSQARLDAAKSGFTIAPEFSPAIDIATDTFTQIGHGLTFYDSVYVVSTGAMPSPLVAGTRYFVVNHTATTFQLSATAGGAAINLTTAGTGVVKIVANLATSTGNSGSFIQGTGNKLSTGSVYSNRGTIIGNGNTVSSLGQARIFGSDNTVTGGFGTAFVMGNGNGQGTSRGTITSGNGLNHTFGNLHSGGGQATFNKGYHNHIDPNAQGAETGGGGVDAHWWGCLARHSHASNGGFGRVIGELSASSGAGFAGGDVEANFSPSNSIANNAYAGTRICLPTGGVASATFDFIIRDLATFNHYAGRRRVVWSQRNYTQGVGRAQDVAPDFTTSVFTFAAHGFTNGNVVYVSSNSAIPTGLSGDVGYFVINTTANDFQLSLTNGGAAVTFANNGVGTINVSQIPPPVITSIEVVGTDSGSNAGLPPAGWSFNIAPFNRRITSGALLFSGVTYALATPSSVPYMHAMFTLPAGAIGYKGTIGMDCQIMRF